MSCKTCNAKVIRNNKTDNIRCAQCNSFYHISCSQISTTMLNDYAQKDKFVWTCVSCTDTDTDCSNMDLKSVLSALKSDVDALKVNNNKIMAQQATFSNALTAISDNLGHLIALEKKVNDNETRINLMSGEIQSLQGFNESLHNENLRLRSEISDIANCSNHLERLYFASNLQIHGIPETNSEELVACVIKLFHHIGASDLVGGDFKYVHRMRSRNATKPIAVEFVSKFKRDYAFNCFKLRKTVAASELGFSADTKIFICEYLSATKKKLLYDARAALLNTDSDFHYKYVWASHGNIYCKKSDDVKPIIINTHADLMKLQY